MRDGHCRSGDYGCQYESGSVPLDSGDCTSGRRAEGLPQDKGDKQQGSTRWSTTEVAFQTFVGNRPGHK
jgi:hypothetical protein